MTCNSTARKHWDEWDNTHWKLAARRICGPRGVRALIDTFKEVKLRGKGHEKADLDLVLAKMEHWAHRLFPQLPFDNFLETVERVGHKKPVQVTRSCHLSNRYTKKLFWIVTKSGSMTLRRPT